MTSTACSEGADLRSAESPRSPTLPPQTEQSLAQAQILPEQVVRRHRCCKCGLVIRGCFNRHSCAVYACTRIFCQISEPAGIDRHYISGEVPPDVSTALLVHNCDRLTGVYVHIVVYRCACACSCGRSTLLRAADHLNIGTRQHMHRMCSDSLRVVHAASAVPFRRATLEVAL